MTTIGHQSKSQQSTSVARCPLWAHVVVQQQVIWNALFAIFHIKVCLFIIVGQGLLHMQKLWCESVTRLQKELLNLLQRWWVHLCNQMQDAGHRNETLMTFFMVITYKLQSRAINKGKNQRIQKLRRKESRVRKNKEYQYREYSSMRTPCRLQHKGRRRQYICDL